MNLSQPLTEVIADARAWTSGTIDPPASWTSTLSASCVAELEEYVRERETDSRALATTSIGDAPFPFCRSCLGTVRSALDGGRGFAIVEHLPAETRSAAEIQAMYLVFGQLLGAPFEQNIEGALLYDVRDTGRDVKQGARFSVTNAESSFHLDNSFGPRVPDYVGLLCLRGARRGGRSQLISAHALHDELVQQQPDILATLYRDFCFDRRGQFAEGESPEFQAPIFYWNGSELHTRYLHYYIQVGHEQSGHPLRTDQEEALEAMEELLRRSDFTVEFSLEPGQMLFTNNHWILHNRTAYEDYPEPERRRHYVRLWLNREKV